MFYTQTTSENTFSHWDDLLTWVEEEAESISRVSINGILQNGAKFQDDRYLGNRSFKLGFTKEGIKALCSRVGFPFVVLEMMNETGLTSRILNDLIRQDSVRNKLANTEFVIDEKVKGDLNGHVCGIVSNKYFGYSNHSFVNDIRKFFDLQDLESFSLKEAFSINTKLHVRLISKHHCGVIAGKGGKSEDITEIGLELGNSMVGDAAVSVDYFLNRLVCANGLVLPAGCNTARVIHSGNTQSFHYRLNRAFNDVFSGLGEKTRYVNELNEIQFLPKRMAELNLSKMIFDIIPGSKSAVIESQRSVFNNFLFRKLSSEEKIRKEELAIRFLPNCFAGKLSKNVFNSIWRDNASMFDLINVFTEHAKEKPPAERIGIQKRSGKLAEWIIKNKKRFN
jgi:hypothetical protein